MNRTVIPALLAALALVPAGAAFAQQTPPPATTSTSDGWRWPHERDFWGYTGASVGWSNYDRNCVPGFGCDEDAVGFKVLVGGNFREVIGLELAYVNLGRADFGGGKTEAQGANLNLTLGVPIAQYGRVFGKVGTIYSWTKVSGTAPGFATGREDGFGWSYGAGATLNLSTNWALRIDWDRYRMDFAGSQTDDVDLVSAGFQYRF